MQSFISWWKWLYQKYILTEEKNHGFLFLPSKILDWPLFDLSILTKQNKQHPVLHLVSSMEELGSRFPLISQIILNNVDDNSLANFRKVSRENSNFLDNERFYWIRNIKKYSSNLEEFQESWKKVINKTPVDFLKNLATDVQSFFQGLIK